jgi:hypothetical protein
MARGGLSIEVGEKPKEPLRFVISYGFFSLLLTIPPALALGALGLLSEESPLLQYALLALIMALAAMQAVMLARLRPKVRPLFSAPALLGYDLFFAMLCAYIFGHNDSMLIAWLILISLPRLIIGCWALFTWNYNSAG